MPSEPKIRSRDAFFQLILDTKATLLGFRINRHAIRLLRKTLNDTTENKQHQAETLAVVFASLAEMRVETKIKEIKAEHVQQWVVPSQSVANDAAEDEAEIANELDLHGEQLHNVRRILQSHRDRQTKTTYFLVDWEPAWEPSSNLSISMIAQFRKERRALVRKTYIEDEVVEDNSTNPQ